MTKYILLFLLLCGQAFAFETAFSPGGGATELIVREIDGARDSVHVAAYGFTNKSIIGALCAAKSRGVEVLVVMDRSQKYAGTCFLVRRDSRYSIMHNKFMVLDGKTVETGSFNYTESAEKRNAENVLVVQDKVLAGIYEGEWKKLWDESE